MLSLLHCSCYLVLNFPFTFCCADLTVDEEAIAQRFSVNKFRKMHRIYIYIYIHTYIHTYICSNYVIYLLECIICKIQHAGKSETSFNIRLNNRRKDIKKPNAIEACKHFNSNKHTFSAHGKFILIEQLRNINTTPTEILKLKLKERENFWVKKLKTLTPYGLNQELN